MATKMMHVTLAGAAAVAALALFSGAHLSEPATHAASGPSASGARIITVDDGGVNDNGQTSGDIFTQNAQDQSTASGAGT
jgi:hypothetical protein